MSQSFTMKHQPILYAFCAALALYPLTVLILHIGSTLPPDYTWSDIARDWGAIFAGGVALIAAVLTVGKMNQQMKQNRIDDDRKTALEYAAYLRTSSGELRSAVQNFAFAVQFAFRAAAKIENDERLRCQDEAEEMESFEFAMRPYSGVSKIYRPNIGYFPHDIRQSCSRFFGFFNHQVDMLNWHASLFAGIKNNRTEALRLFFEAELKLNWTVALIEVAANCVESQETVQADLSQMSVLASEYVKKANIPLMLVSLFEKYDVQLSLDHAAEHIFKEFCAMHERT